jgi:D-threo-aldose 1-dehydrogenase
MARNSMVRLRTGVEISQLGLGTAAFGGLYTSVTESDVAATMRAAFDSGITYIDTAPHYGKGVAERRLAPFITGANIHLSTKVGRLLAPCAHDVDEYFKDADTTVERIKDYSAAGVERSLKESLERLQINCVDFLFIHDPDLPAEADQAIAEAYPALEKMRNQGLIKGIGIGMNSTSTPTRFIRETDIDMVLIAGRYSLLDRTAESDLLPAALAKGVDVIAAGVFNSGVFANPVAGSTFDYDPAPAEVIEKAQRLRALCAEFSTSPTVAALQFPLRHPAVKAVLVGCRDAGEVIRNCQAFDSQVPQELWAALG